MKKFVVLLVEMMASKSPFEINCPLMSRDICIIGKAPWLIILLCLRDHLYIMSAKEHRGWGQKSGKFHYYVLLMKVGWVGPKTSDFC